MPNAYFCIAFTLATNSVQVIHLKNRLFYTYRVLQQVLDKELSVKISNLAKLEFLVFVKKKFVKLKGDMLCLA